MANHNITWDMFAVCNENKTKAFEEMCRRLFKAKYLKGKVDLHANHNTPGIEVLPVWEPEGEAGQKLRRISFQSKYVAQAKDAYSQFKKSAKQTVKHFRGEVDCVYLFCNKTLSTTTQSFQEIVKIHKDAGIDTIPVTNDDLLDLLAEYTDIAESYFPYWNPFGQGTMKQPYIRETIINVSNNVGNVIISQAVRSLNPDNNKLEEAYLAEKLALCKNYAAEQEIEDLRNELNDLFSKGIDEFKGNGIFYYFQLLTQLSRGEDTAVSLANCGIEYRQDAKWLIDFYATPKAVTPKELKKYLPYTQIFVVSKLFEGNQWNNIKELFLALKDNIDQLIISRFALFYGLSLLNLQEFQEASATLYKLYDRNKKESSLFYAVLADIRGELSIYQIGEAGHHDVLAARISQLDSLKELKQYKLQESFVAAIRFEAYFHLGKKDKGYLTRAIAEFEELPENVQLNPGVQFYYALCLELQGGYVQAVSFYDNLDWKVDPVVAERYMLCLFNSGQAEKTITVYKALTIKRSRLDGIYLLALESSGDKTYQNELARLLSLHRNDFSDYLETSYYINKECVAKEYVIPALKVMLDEETVKSLSFSQKVELLNSLSRWREIELMEIVLETLENVAVLNEFTVTGIFNALFDVADREYTFINKKYGKKEDIIEIAKRIADRFLDKNIARELFLHIEILYAGIKNLPIKSLEYAKDLFELSQDETTACIIITGLCHCGENKPEEYEQYLEFLKKSRNPAHCMVVGYAMLVLGRTDAAEFYAYKALYLLNDKDDYDVYASYVILFNKQTGNAWEEELTVIRGNVVVVLAKSNIFNEKEELILCLDSEADFSNDANRSMGIVHLSPKNIDYIKLQGCKLKDTVKLGEIEYQVMQIIPRHQYGLIFILHKAQKTPEMFKGIIWTFPTNNIEETIQLIKKHAKNSDRTEFLLKAYHLEMNSTGLPFDVLASGSLYDYVNVLKYFLFQKDEAFFAGLPRYGNIEKQKYVPGLSTLVLLSILGRMDVLVEFKRNIIIPESYVPYLEKEYAKAVDLVRTSSVNLTFLDDKPLIFEHDISVVDALEDILRFCQTCDCRRITNQERVDFNFTEGLPAEKMISDMKLNLVHLDALLLAQKEQLTYLCDDAFFRKLATSLNICNLNIATLIQCCKNSDFVIQFIIALSKTNYIFVPFLYRTDVEAQVLYKNIVNGKRKQLYYQSLMGGSVRWIEHLIQQ